MLIQLHLTRSMGYIYHWIPGMTVSWNRWMNGRKSKDTFDTSSDRCLRFPLLLVLLLLLNDSFSERENCIFASSLRFISASLHFASFFLFSFSCL